MVQTNVNYISTDKQVNYPIIMFEKLEAYLAFYEVIDQLRFIIVTKNLC